MSTVREPNAILYASSGFSPLTTETEPNDVLPAILYCVPAEESSLRVFEMSVFTGLRLYWAKEAPLRLFPRLPQPV